MSEAFTLFWSKMLDSSIWMEDGPTRLVWITMLLMKNEEGVVKTASVKALAHRARVSVEECQRALEIFLSPDTETATGKEDGRRIERGGEGWKIINHEDYRYSSEARREFWRRIKAEERAKKGLAEARVRSDYPHRSLVESMSPEAREQGRRGQQR